MKLTQPRFVHTEDCFRSYNIRKLTNNFKLSSEYMNCHHNVTKFQIISFYFRRVSQCIEIENRKVVILENIDMLMLDTLEFWKSGKL